MPNPRRQILSGEAHVSVRVVIYRFKTNFFADELDRELNRMSPWEFIGERVTVDEDEEIHLSDGRNRTDIEEFVTRETRITLQ